MCPVSTVVPSLELEGDVDPTHIRGTLKIQILEATEENDNGKLLYPELGWTIKNFLGFPFWAKATIIDDPVRIISEGDLRNALNYWNLLLMSSCQLRNFFQP